MMLRSSNGLSKTPWFERLSRHQRPPLRMFCFPYAGGSAQIFQTWQRYLSPEIDVCLVHLPGRGMRINEKAFTRISALVAAIADQIIDEIMDPFVLYGHSMGALISFELSREIFRRSGRTPLHLFLSGHRAPQWPRSRKQTFHLPDKEFIAKLKDLNGTPIELFDHPEMKAMFLPALRADFEMVETYEFSPGQPLSCPMTVYGGLQDSHVPLESLHAWGVHSTAGCKARMLKGDHFFIRSSEKEFVNILRSDVLNVLTDTRMKRT
jgi:medium-chain acyl-[acyl-carrier-protein] hydrolase